MKRLLLLLAATLFLVGPTFVVISGASASVVQNPQHGLGIGGQIQTSSFAQRTTTESIHTGIFHSSLLLLGIDKGKVSTSTSKKKSDKKTSKKSDKKTDSKKGKRNEKLNTKRKSTSTSKKKSDKKTSKSSKVKKQQTPRSQSSKTNKSSPVSTTVKNVVVTTTKPVTTTTMAGKTTTTIANQKVLFTYSGTKSVITSSFNVPPGGWTLKYSYTCNPSDSLFDAVIYQGNSIDINDFGAKVANQGTGSGSYYYLDYGSFNIHVTDYKCSRWTVTAVTK